MRSLKLWVLAALVLPSSAFPLYTTVNGTVVLASAFGGDVELAPDAGGMLHRLGSHCVLPKF